MQQKIYPKEVHELDIRQIDKEALYVLEKLTASGFVAYLVGGGVRDLLLKKKPKDYDISTSAEPEQIKKLFRNCILIGRRFRLAHIRFGKKIIEASTFRSGDTENDALIIRDNEWGSPEEDVLRRDFTINGLFYDMTNQTVIDYVGGFEDLEKGLLKTIGQPFIRFKQDPVRMLRLLKFKARFGFSIDHDAHIALIETKHEITKSAPARILEELLRMLELGSSHPFFTLLAEYGFLPLILPGIASFIDGNEGEEIYAFLQELDRAALEGIAVDRSVALSCLIFPLLQRRIKTLFEGREKPPHLGEIQEEAFSLFRESFEFFFHIPKRLKMEVISVITTQFRLTPLEKRKSRTLRVPNDPNFKLALEFLKLRTCLEPGLQKILSSWEEATEKVSEEPSLPSKKRKRRRRRKPEGTSEASSHEPKTT